MAGELLLQLAELVETIVENRGGQRGVGVAGTEHLYEIRGSARAPKRSAIEVIRHGSVNAAELMLILSAPASKTSTASPRLRMPPPTVKGMNNCFAVRRTVSSSVALPW